MAFGICLNYSVRYFPKDLESTTQDVAREYRAYEAIVHGETLDSEMARTVLFTSTLSVTWLPAIIQRLTGINEYMLFRYYSSLIIPLLPMIVYLLALHFVSQPYALVSAGVFMSQYGFIHAPVYQRTLIALLFVALMLWLVFRPMNNKLRIALVILCALGVVLSHYTVAYIMIIILVPSIACLFIWRWLRHERSKLLLWLVVGLVALMAFAGVWYGVVTRYPLHYAGGTATSAFQQLVGQKALMKILPSGLSNNLTTSIWDREARDPVTQFAFGEPLNISNWYKVYLAYNWLVMALTLLGASVMAWSVWKGRGNTEMTVLALGSLGVGLIAVVIPAISNQYGLTRTYLQITIPLSVALAWGLKWVNDKSVRLIRC